MIEQYGTGIPRIKRYYDAEGVAFTYRQTGNTTVIRFDRPGSQIVEESPSDTEGTERAQGLEKPFDPAGAAAMRITRKNGKVTHGGSQRRADKSDRNPEKAGRREVALWVGRNAKDPYQYYRLPDID